MLKADPFLKGSRECRKWGKLKCLEASQYLPRKYLPCSICHRLFIVMHHVIRLPQCPCQQSETSRSGCRTKSEQVTVPVLQILHVIGDKCISRDDLESYRRNQPLEYSQHVLTRAPQHSPRAAIRSAQNIKMIYKLFLLAPPCPSKEQHAMGYHGPAWV